MCSLLRSCLAGALLLVACAPRDVIPSTPQHPASPTAPIVAPVADAGVADAQPAVVDEKQAIAAEEKAAYEKARPIFQMHCSKCHSKDGAKATAKKLDHFDLDTYPFGGHHAATAGKSVRAALGVEGGEATMPADRPGSVKGAELEAIVAWSRAFDRAHEAGLHGDHGGHH